MKDIFKEHSNHKIVEFALWCERNEDIFDIYENIENHENDQKRQSLFTQRVQ